MKRIVAVLAITIGTLATVSVLAGPSSIVVEHSWARATPKGAMIGAAYVMLINNGTGEDRLVGASSPVAESIQFHSETNDTGVMKMVQLLTLTMHPGSPIVLKPGGIHLMLLGLKQQLLEGQSIPITFSFEKAGAVTVAARVGKIGAMEYPDTRANSGG